MDKHTKRKRVREIIAAFARHGIRSGWKGITDPVHLRLAFEELGPTFIKIGQILSTRPDMLPEPYIKEFSRLQDNVRPEPYGEIRRVIEEELHASVENLFTSFEQEAYACASMAEVHRATLPDGRRVMVKVQRPRARETMMEDIAILKAVSGVERIVPEGGIVSLREIVDQIEHTARQELNFLHEAENTRTFARNNAGVRYITCPEVYAPYTTRKVLVMGQIEGVRVDDADALQSEGYDLTEIGTKLARNYLKQIFEDGFFHADPHPGNLMITGGRIAYLDFGIMGVMGPELRGKFNAFLEGIALNDVSAMTRAVLNIGIKKGPVDMDTLEDDIDELYHKYISASLYDIRMSETISEVFTVCRKNKLGLPAEFALLCKGLATLEGVVAKIAPGLNIMNIAVPYARQRTFRSGGEWDAQRLLEDVGLLYAAGSKMPRKMMELVNNALSGRLVVKMELKNHKKDLDALNRMVNRVVFGLIVSAMIVGSSVVVYANAGPRLFGMSVIGVLGYLGAAVFGFWLLISILRSNRM